MNLKKILFGNLNYDKQSDDGKKKLSIEYTGGLLPSIVVFGTIIGFIVWLLFR